MSFLSKLFGFGKDPHRPHWKEGRSQSGRSSNDGIPAGEEYYEEDEENSLDPPWMRRNWPRDKLKATWPNLTLNEVYMLKEIFNIFDLDEKGYFTRSELLTVMKAMGNGYKPNQQDVQSVMMELDSDSDGVVTFPEFLTKYMNVGDTDALTNLFKALSIQNDDGDNYITIDALKKCFRLTGHELQDSDTKYLAMIFQAADKDGNNQLDLIEFMTYLESIEEDDHHLQRHPRGGVMDSPRSATNKAHSIGRESSHPSHAGASPRELKKRRNSLIPAAWSILSRSITRSRKDAHSSEHHSKLRSPSTGSHALSSRNQSTSQVNDFMLNSGSATHGRRMDRVSSRKHTGHSPLIDRVSSGFSHTDRSSNKHSPQGIEHGSSSFNTRHIDSQSLTRRTPPDHSAIRISATHGHLDSTSLSHTAMLHGEILATHGQYSQPEHRPSSKHAAGHHGEMSATHGHPELRSSSKHAAGHHREIFGTHGHPEHRPSSKHAAGHHGEMSATHGHPEHKPSSKHAAGHHGESSGTRLRGSHHHNHAAERGLHGSTLSPGGPSSSAHVEMSHLTSPRSASTAPCQESEHHVVEHRPLDKLSREQTHAGGSTPAKAASPRGG